MPNNNNASRSEGLNRSSGSGPIRQSLNPSRSTRVGPNYPIPRASNRPIPPDSGNVIPALESPLERAERRSMAPSRRRLPQPPSPSAASEGAAARRNQRITLLNGRRRISIPTSNSSARNNVVGPLDSEGPLPANSNSNASSPGRGSRSRRASLSTYRPLFNVQRPPSPGPVRRRQSRSKSKNRVTFSIASFSDDPIAKVLNSEKHLPKVLQFMNWNELLPIRLVCKKWLEVVTADPLISARTGVIVIRNPWEEAYVVFNNSPVIWNRFRMEANVFVDLIDAKQLEFWQKHGPSLRYLEIKNLYMTLSGLVEILSRCPNLEHFLVQWTPEMYSFNSELIKKYYGINFYIGNFSSMRSFTVEKSSYLTDNALWSMLKWCGGVLKSISLTYPPEDQQDPLTRLKPRWTIQPLINYAERFSYTENLQYLNFAWSNLAPEDLVNLAKVHQLTSLKGITLSHCRLNDTSVNFFLERKGNRLEELIVDNVPLTEGFFGDVRLHKLHRLDISGPKGKFNFTFLPQLPNLKELYAADTTWMDYDLLIKHLKGKMLKGSLNKVNLAGSIKVNGAKQMDPNMNRVWLTNLAHLLEHVVSLDLSGWEEFGKNENFRMICQTILQLEELRIRGWKWVTDVGITGLPPEKLHQTDVNIGFKESKNRVFIGSLKHLHTLDLSGTGISDASIKYGISSLFNLRKLGFENTNISDTGIDMITEKITSIDHISIRGCDKIQVKVSKFKRSDGRFVFVGKI